MRLPGIYRIKSNLKREMDILLGERVFIVGANETYKSAIGQSLELCLSRGLSVHGKTYSESQPYKFKPLQISPDQPIKIWCQSKAADVHFRLDKSDVAAWGGQYTDLTTEERKHIFPISHVREILSFEARKAREEIVKIFCTDASVKTPALSALQREMWAEGEKAATRTGAKGPAETLSEIATWARNQKGAKTKAANRLSESVVTQKALAETPGLEALSSLELKLQDAIAYDNAAPDRALLKKCQKDLSLSQEEVAALRQQIENKETTFKGIYQAMQSQLIDMDAEVAEIESKLKEAESKEFTANRFYTTIVRQIQIDPHVCPFEHPANNLPAQEKRLAQRLADNRAVADKIRDALRDVERSRQDLEDKMEQTETVFRVETEDLKTEIQALSIRMAELKAEENTTRRRVEIAPSTYSGLPVDQLRERVENLRQASAAREIYEKAISERERLEDESRACGRVEEAAVLELSRLLKAAKESAETEVNQLMPSKDRAVLNLEDDDCEWLVTGQDGQPHPRISQSGFQRGCLTLALAGCLSKRSRLSIVKLDDEDLAGFDGDHILWLLDRLGEMQSAGIFSQVVVISNREDLIPRIPKTYTLIHCTHTDSSISQALGEKGVEEISYEN